MNFSLRVGGGFPPEGPRLADSKKPARERARAMRAVPRRRAQRPSRCRWSGGVRCRPWRRPSRPQGSALPPCATEARKVRPDQVRARASSRASSSSTCRGDHSGWRKEMPARRVWRAVRSRPLATSHFSATDIARRLCTWRGWRGSRVTADRIIGRTLGLGKFVAQNRGADVPRDFLVRHRRQLADNKWSTRLTVAAVVINGLASLDLALRAFEELVAPDRSPQSESGLSPQAVEGTGCPRVLPRLLNGRGGDRPPRCQNARSPLALVHCSNRILNGYL